MISDYSYLIFRVATSLIAGALGIIATVSDFHERRNGREVLSKRGRLWIAVLLASTSLSVSVDTWKELNENRASAGVSRSLQTIATALDKTGKTLEQTSGDLEGTLNDTNERLKQAQASLDKSSTGISNNVKLSKSVLEDTHRALDPIQRDWLLGGTLEVSADHPLVQPYLERIEGECKMRDADRVELGFSNVSFSFPQTLRTDEKILAELAHFKTLEIAFKKQLKDEVGLTVTAHCDPEPDAGEAQIQNGACDRPEEYGTLARGNHVAYDRHRRMGGGEDRKNLNISCYTENIDFGETPLIRSYGDISGSTVRVEVQMKEWGQWDEELTKDFEIPFALSEVFFRTKAGNRYCALDHLKRVPCDPSQSSAPAAERIYAPYRSSCFVGSVPEYCWAYKAK